MRILHVFSAEFFAGSVAYAVALAEAHRRQGHQVWLASDATRLPTQASLVPLPISNRTYKQRYRNIQALRELIGREKIDVVHAHSRAASWVSYWAVRGRQVPLVSTVHGRQHLHASTSLFDIYGQRVVAICENLARHLRDEVKMSPEKIVVVPNGVAFGELRVKSYELRVETKEVVEPVGAEAWSPAQPANQEAGPLALTAETEAQLPAQLLTPNSQLLTQRVAFIGRFNGPKGERAAALMQHVFPGLLREVPALRVALIGGELAQLPAAGHLALAALQAEFGERVEVVGFTDDVAGWLACTSLVVGAGRVAIEALGVGVPTLALGEACYAGPVTEATYAEAAASNFGDILPRAGDEAVAWEQVLADARAALAAGPGPPALAARVRHDYALATVAARVLAVYESARMQLATPGWLPVLMYHKVPDAPPATKHQIFVTQDNFARHLAFFRRQGFTTLTFRDYQDFASGRRPLAEWPRRPLMLTFDDGYLDNYANALPLMQQAGYRGVLYLLGDFDLRHNAWDLAADPTEPRAELLSPEQKQAFVAAGWEIGAHTMTHPHLSQLPPTQALHELAASKAELERRLGIEVVSVAYPYGDLTEETKQLAAAAGFSYAVATDTGGLHLEADRMQIFRVNVFPHETDASLRKKTSSWYRRYYRWKRGR